MELFIQNKEFEQYKLIQFLGLVSLVLQ